MSKLKRAGTFFLLASALVLTGGCVSQSKYLEVEDERDQLQMKNDQLQAEKAELTNIAIALFNEVELFDEEVAQLENEMQEIEADLETLVVAGSIQMRLMKNGLRLILDDDVLFSSGSAELSAAGKDTISKLTAELAEVPYQIVVIGNTDNVPIGPNTSHFFPSNWALAAARASAVVRQMADDGIPKQQLIAVSFGDTQPIATNDTLEGRSENRRIEVRLRPLINE